MTIARAVAFAPMNARLKPLLWKKTTNMEFIEGSQAIAKTIKNIQPEVISAYPITPQTHIVETLARYRADGESDYEYIRAESEFAAASIVLGASAAGARTYSATSSQGLLLMSEVIFNLSGMRLPVVMTVANRAISSPINIWNDQSDIMAVRDAGWIMLFATNHQEAVDMHVMAYKLAEKLSLPVMVNVDGFIITHSLEAVEIPSPKLIKKYLPNYKPELGTYLDPQQPITLGAFFTPSNYMEERKTLHEDLLASQKNILEEYKIYKKLSHRKELGPKALVDNGLIEYYGSKSAKTIIIALGSVVGTILAAAAKDASVGVLKLKSFRPFPKGEIIKIIAKAKNVAVIDKAISPGNSGQLFIEVAALTNRKQNISSHIVGLGGRDISEKIIKQIIKIADKKNLEAKFWLN